MSCDADQLRVRHAEMLLGVWVSVSVCVFVLVMCFCLGLDKRVLCCYVCLWVFFFYLKYNILTVSVKD